MKIGIIVFSQTNHTYSVAEKIRKKLGSNATIERIELAEGSTIRDRDMKLKTAPKVDKYDVVIFGSPVHGFSLSLVMNAYLEQLESLKDKRIMCFVTESFAYPWLGGSRAIKQMKKICESKDGEVAITNVVNWGNKKREEMINDTVEKSTEIIKK